MNETDQSIDNTGGSSKSDENRSHRKKSSSKASTNETETATTNGEKKRKAPKIAAATKDSTEQEHIYETKDYTNTDKENGTHVVSNTDQEVPHKPKKKRAPKIDPENNESMGTEQPVKKKKPKAPNTPAINDEFQMNETPAVDELDSYVEPKPKVKKSRKSKASIQPTSDSFEDFQASNFDDVYSADQQIDDAVPDMSFDTLPPQTTDDTSELQQSIVDSFSNLASKVNFSQYFVDDIWSIIHLPKGARVEPKSRIRKMLPGGHKDEKPGTKPTAPKPKLFTRIRSGVNTLVRDPNNLLFGERSNYELNEEEEPEDVDTDSLHRYAQQLRELEDQDREINPEFLVLQDGKTVYGVHESDVDGKVKLSKRKPIYDRFADQKPDQQSEKKKLLARLKVPFTRNKDGKDNKSTSETPDARANRKSSRKSLSDDLTSAPDEDPLMI